MVDLDVWVVALPDADVVTVLVADTGTLDVEFHVNAVSFHADVEEFTSDGDGSREEVLGFVDTLRSCQSAGGEFTVIRGYCFFGTSEGWEAGGNEGSVMGVAVCCGWVGGWSKGKEGAAVNNSGEGIVGGGQ